MPVNAKRSTLLDTLVRLSHGVGAAWLVLIGVGLSVLSQPLWGQEPIGPKNEQRRIDFVRDIQPLLEQHCLDCHGPDLQESAFRVDSRRTFLTGGDLYPRLVVKGDPDSSPLLKIVSGQDPDLRMPPDEPYLSQTEVDLLEQWIREGAVWPDSAANESSDPQPHWSLLPLSPQAVSDSAILNRAETNQSTINPVDFWIDRELQKFDLSRSTPAEPRILVRRLYLTLTGLPPTPEQLDSFLKDSRTNAYELLVDELLDSPQFGAHWAQSWLDTVRFAESDGFETNHERPQAYRYRDWVITSWNSDQPFAEFVRQQIAGDQLGQPVATGFLVGGTYDIVKGQDDDLSKTQRENELADMVNTTGTAFLGLTVGCARCHNHKFDPISQTDYFAMQALLAGVNHGVRSIQPVLDPQSQTRLKELEQQLAKWEQTFFATALPDVSHAENIEQFAPITAKRLRFWIDQTNSAEPCLDELEVFGPVDPANNLALAKQGVQPSSSGNYAGDPQHQLSHINDGQFGNSHSWIASSNQDAWVQLEFPQPVEINRIVWSRDRRPSPPAYQDRLPIRYRIEVSPDGITWQTVASSANRRSGIVAHWRQRLMQADAPLDDDLQTWQDYQQALRERSALTDPLQIYAGDFRQPPPIHRLHRGEHRQPRELVLPAQIAAIAGPDPIVLSAEAAEPARRLALADWLADPRNPLTYRVAVNRIWQNVFGTGIVATPSDFGRMGSSPSHPELLDWMAAKFLEMGGSRKEFIRLLVTSQTFRQSSQPRTEALQVDAQARYLWRFPPRRLTAEMIRDGLLLLTGHLDDQLGGPGFLLFVPNDNYARNWVAKTEFGTDDFRRLIFATRIRMEGDAIFSAFDVPDGGQICPVRARSTTPLQAMHLFNSDFVIDLAQRLSDQIASQTRKSEDQVTAVFHKLLLRQPDALERQWSLEFIKAEGLPALCRAVINTNEFVWLE